jgi:hypothetical protein
MCKGKMKEEKIKVSNWTSSPQKEDKPMGVFELEGGYWITKPGADGPKTVKLTNWCGIVEAIVVKNENERDRKINIKCGNYSATAFMNGLTLTNTAHFREFLLNNFNIYLLFYGTDNDLQALVEYWGKQTDPVIVRETECVGEIPEGFITENVFVGHDGKIQEISKGLAYISPKQCIQVARFVSKAGKIAGLPIFPLNEPTGGIDKFKTKVFDLMVKNRNLKVAVAIGWNKATLWSDLFYRRKKWFPLFMTHGKHQCGKSVLATWLLSMMGMRDLKETSIRKSQYEAGSERHFSYYSSLPVHFCDYRNTEKEGQRFHSFFRNIFDRSSVSKGNKNNPLEVRQVEVRGCLLLDGENSPSDAGLNSRMITFEMTEAERVEKYYDEIVKLEPDFSYIGMDWIKHRIKDFEPFMTKYDKIDNIFRKSILSPRQAQCWAVAIAAALTESYFNKDEEKLIQYAIRLANQEMFEQKNEEIIGNLWEATDILGHLPEEILYYDWQEKLIKIHLAALLDIISIKSRRYQFPNVREVGKLLKQEKYVVENSKKCCCGGKHAKRFVLDFEHPALPESLKNMFGENVEDVPKISDWKDL